MQLQAETGDMMRSQSDSMLGLTWMFQGSDALMIASVQPHEWSLRPQDAMTSPITTHGARWLNDLGKSAVAAHPALNGYAAAMPAYIYSLMDPIVWGDTELLNPGRKGVKTGCRADPCSVPGALLVHSSCASKQTLDSMF